MTSCPCCHCGESKVLGAASDRLFHTTDKEFELHECGQCGIIFLAPTPREEEIASYYPCGYWWQTADRSHQANSWHKLLDTYRQAIIRGLVRRIRRLATKVPGSRVRLLDVGCGDGLFLAACEQPRWVLLGLDQSLDALGAARERALLGVTQGTVNSLPFGGDSVDLITMLHVLEHLPEPHQPLREVHRALSPDGLLVVQVPNARSLQRYLFGRRWAGFDAPRHLVNYSSKTLRALLEQNGFSLVWMSHFSPRDNPAMPVMSLFPWLYPPARRLVAPTPGGRPWVNSLLDVSYFILVFLATPLAFAESLVGRGGTIVAAAEKTRSVRR